MNVKPDVEWKHGRLKINLPLEEALRRALQSGPPMRPEALREHERRAATVRQMRRDLEAEIVHGVRAEGNAVPEVPSRTQTPAPSKSRRSAPVRNVRRADGKPQGHREALPQAHDARPVAGASRNPETATDSGGTMSATRTGESVRRTRRPAKAQPRCLPIAARGIETSRDFAGMMSALMSDIIEERIDARAANAVCNAGGKLLKIVELQQKYGVPIGNTTDKTLALAPRMAPEDVTP